MDVPTEYRVGYAATRPKDPARADNYILHNRVGDPLADAATLALSELPAAESRRLIRAGMDDLPEVLAAGPPQVAALFEDATRIPDWVDLDSYRDGSRLFFRHSNIVLGAMLAGVLIEGFSTNIANSFLITGRIQDQGIRRLKQNNHHLIEIFMPGGMDRRGDGWKLSVRLRLVHARIRRLLAQSPDWDAAAWGTPVSAAHLGYAIAAFSAGLLHHMSQLGASIPRAERESFMGIWRYSGHLMGVPDTILFRDEDEANRILRIGRGCEPPVDLESIIMAHALVNSAPLALGMTQTDERRSMARYIFSISRALIGNQFADELRFPKTRVLGVVPWFRLRTRYNSFMARHAPALTRRGRFENFTELLKTATFEQNGISYRLPSHVCSERSHPW